MFPQQVMVDDFISMHLILWSCYYLLHDCLGTLLHFIYTFIQFISYFLKLHNLISPNSSITDSLVLSISRYNFTSLFDYNRFGGSFTQHTLFCMFHSWYNALLLSPINFYSNFLVLRSFLIDFNPFFKRWYLHIITHVILHVQRLPLQILESPISLYLFKFLFQCTLLSAPSYIYGNWICYLLRWI